MSGARYPLEELLPEFDFGLSGTTDHSIQLSDDNKGNLNCADFDSSDDINKTSQVLYL